MTEKTEAHDTVAPFVFGYSTSSISLGDVAHPRHLGPRKYDLKKNISAGVFENGSVFFDFGRCKETPLVIHRESLWNDVERDENGALSDGSVSKRLRRTESRQRLNQSFYRSVLLAHVLLLENAGRLIGGASFSLPRIEKIHDDAFSCWDIPEVLPSTSIEDSAGLRLGTNVIDRSFSDLDRALTIGNGALLQAIEFHKLSHYRILDQRFAESLVLSWTICENMIDFLWKRMVKDVRSSDPRRMTKKRADTLGNTSAFNASVRIETLELSGYLSIELATNLNEVRKMRNKWLHSLEGVEEQSSLHSIETCAHLISSVFEMEICDMIVSGSGGEGGGMFLKVFEDRYPSVDLRGAYDGEC